MPGEESLQSLALETKRVTSKDHLISGTPSVFVHLKYMLSQGY